MKHSSIGVILLLLILLGIGNVEAQEAIDLGLSVKWASCNVGANHATEFGNCYAWGEIETKVAYTPKNSKWFGVDFDALKHQGVIDGHGNLTSEHDAASFVLGYDWRLPTRFELEELKTKCQWEWVTQHGVDLFMITGPNGNRIYLPATGYKVEQDDYNASVYGYYWSATAYRNDKKAYGLSYINDYYDRDFYLNRYCGRYIRAVHK